jgi:hypothetical protein
MNNLLPEGLTLEGKYLVVTPQTHGVDGAFAARMVKV